MSDLVEVSWRKLGAGDVLVFPGGEVRSVRAVVRDEPVVEDWSVIWERGDATGVHTVQFLAACGGVPHRKEKQ